MDYALKYDFDKVKNKWLIYIQGEVDIYNSTSLKEQLISLLNQKPCDLYISCDCLDYIDSTGLGVLVAVLKTAKQLDCNIILSKLKPSVLKLFKITDLNKVFVIEGDANE